MTHSINVHFKWIPNKLYSRKHKFLMTYFFNPRFILAHLTDLIISVVAAEKIGKKGKRISQRGETVPITNCKDPST